MTPLNVKEDHETKVTNAIIALCEVMKDHDIELELITEYGIGILEASVCGIDAPSLADILVYEGIKR